MPVKKPPPPDVNATCAARLKQARAQNNFTQADLAQATGIDVASISRYENNDRTPGLHPLALLADALNVTVDWLIGK